MGDCSFENLVYLLDGKLSPAAQSRTLNHLDGCEICRDTMYHIAKDREEAAVILSPQKRKAARGNNHPKDRAPESMHKPAREASALARPAATGTHG